MEQEQICEMLKQIIPELQAKIREELKIEYDNKIREIQAYYQDQIQKLIKNQQRLLSEFQSKNDAHHRNQKDIQELYSRIAILQSQRKNWSNIEIQYQSTIKELTQLLLAKGDGKIQLQSRQSLNISENIKNVEFNSVNAVHPPPKSAYIEQRLYICNQEKVQKIPKFGENSNLNINQQSGIGQNSLAKYIKQNHTNTVSDQQSCDHYHSVLSPPKQQGIKKTKRLFWDDNKKKQLLSMIKLH